MYTHANTQHTILSHTHTHARTHAMHPDTLWSCSVTSGAGIAETLVHDLEFLKQRDVGPGIGQPLENTGKPRADRIDVPGGDRGNKIRPSVSAQGLPPMF